MRLAFVFGRLALMCVAASGSAFAEAPPDIENGRYSMSPIVDGVLRLDTRTGVVSTCTNNGNGWACYTVPDERAALDAEIGRLRDDNDKLRTQLAQRDTVTGKTEEALPKQDPLAPRTPKTAEGANPSENRKLEIPLPSDRDMDRVMGFLESAWKRLVDLASRMQKDASKI